MTAPTLSGLADVVRSLTTPGDVLLERAGPSTTAPDGSAQRGTVTQSMISPTVLHPISGRDRVLLPEGYRTRETITIYYTEPLRTVREYGDQADVIIHRPFGEPESRYVVVTVENWALASGHWRTFAVREPDDDA